MASPTLDLSARPSAAIQTTGEKHDTADADVAKRSSSEASIGGATSDHTLINHQKQEEEHGSLTANSLVLDSGVGLVQLYPLAHELLPRPPPANECNFTHYYAVDVGKEFHDQYVFRHANGLCVIGLAPSHVAFTAGVSITAVDFNVGKSSRADMKAVGKRKKNAHVLEGNSVLCKVLTGEAFYLIRCCVRGTLLEVNHRLINDPHLLVSHRDTEGHIAIMMPRPEDWAKAEKSLLTREQYRAQKGLSV